MSNATTTLPFSTCVIGDFATAAPGPITAREQAWMATALFAARTRTLIAMDGLVVLPSDPACDTQALWRRVARCLSDRYVHAVCGEGTVADGIHFDLKVQPPAVEAIPVSVAAVISVRDVTLMYVILMIATPMSPREGEAFLLEWLPSAGPDGTGTMAAAVAAELDARGL